METTYYRDLVEECASMHGWRDEAKDGEAACFMYREILKRGNMISNLEIVNDALQAQDTYRMKASMVLALCALGLGLALGWAVL